MIFILIGVLILLLVLWIKYFKVIRCGNMILITGGIKTGKTMLGVWQSRQLLTRQRLRVFLYNHLMRYLKMIFTFKLEAKKPRPLLYSNIPLSCEYVPVTDQMLRREQRIVDGSVMYLCEASLIADSMTFKDGLLNEQLLLFNKLFAHYSHGGYLIYDTQSISDNHYAVKRCLSSYFYIHHMVKIPFFCVMFLQEMKFSEDGSIVNAFTSDIEDTLKVHIVPKKVWKMYDCYCYSVLTDDKTIVSDCHKSKDLKARSIVSFKKYATIGSDKDDKK